MSGARDVVVVGSGVAGLAAALAASQAGAQVTVVLGGSGASALSGGAWDVASTRGGDDDDGPPRTLALALDRVARERPSHPWARLPRARVLEALAASHEAVLGALGTYRPLGASPDALRVVSDLGIARSAATAQTSVLDLAPLAGARIAVATVRALRSFDGRFVAASLNERAVRAGDARRFVAIEVELLRRGGDATLLPHEAAGLLDAAEVRALAIRALRRAIGGVAIDAVLAPPILGLRDDAVAASIIAGVGVPVGEAVESLAGAQGLRLARRIGDALGAHGITQRAAWAARVAVDADGVTLTLAEGEALRPGALVLATGKHVGGGVEVSGGEPREPLAGLPIHVGGAPLPLSSSGRGRDPRALFGEDPLSPGAGFAMGVGWDERLRPLDAHGRPVSRSLFACGALLEGTAAGDGTGLGVAAATGWIAGRNAAARAGR